MAKLTEMQKMIDAQNARHEEFKASILQGQLDKEHKELAAKYCGLVPTVSEKDALDLVKQIPRATLNTIFSQMNEIKGSMTTGGSSSGGHKSTSSAVPLQSESAISRILKPMQSASTRNAIPMSSGDITTDQLPSIARGLTDKQLTNANQALRRTALDHNRSMWNDPFVANMVSASVNHLNNS
jgi:hypothetical protein